MNLDAVECSTKRCSGNGRCVETSGGTACVCSSSYSGDSCQDHLFKTMQGPIVYGAAGLCAAVVIIIVMAVVVKRRKTANTRFVWLLISRNLPTYSNMPVGGGKVYINMPDIILSVHSECIFYFSHNLNINNSFLFIQLVTFLNLNTFLAVPTKCKQTRSLPLLFLGAHSLHITMGMYKLPNLYFMKIEFFMTKTEAINN